MSKCTLRLELEDGRTHYRAGELVRGLVRVRVDGSVTCQGLKVELGWSTRGRGNTSRGVSSTQVLHVGEWGEGMYDYPFELQAPDGPLPYEGTLLSIDYAVSASADVPWAIDPKVQEGITLEPGPHPRHLPAGPSSFGLGVGNSKAVVFWVFLGIFAFAMFPCGFVLIPILVLFFFPPARNRLASLQLGSVQVDMGDRQVCPGDEVRVSVQTERGIGSIPAPTVRLQGYERVVSGSGKNSRTHTHILHDEVRPLVPQGGRLEALVPIPPETRAWSFQAGSNRVEWIILVELKGRGWLTWSQAWPLSLAPSPANALPAPVPALKAKRPAPVPAPVPAPPPAPVPAPPPVVLPTPAPNKPRPAPEVPKPPVQPSADRDWTVTDQAPAPPAKPAPAAGASTTADTGDLTQLCAQMAQASPFGDELPALIRGVAERDFTFVLRVERVERSYSMSLPDEFRDGRELLGTLPDGTQILVTLPESQLSVAEALRPGASVTLRARVLTWSTLYARLEMLGEAQGS